MPFAKPLLRHPGPAKELALRRQGPGSLRRICQRNREDECAGWPRVEGGAKQRGGTQGVQMLGYGDTVQVPDYADQGG